jgi:acyl-coenzyme A synthetase/AMP-(fatty) acid ligase
MNLFNTIFENELSTPAIRFDGRTISYAELRAETVTMAQVIRSLGAARGDRVALLLHDSPEFVEAFIATCSLGAIAVPVNMALRAEEQCSILHNSGANLAIIEADTCRALLTHAPEKLQSLEKAIVVERSPGKRCHENLGPVRLLSLELLRDEAIETPTPDFGDPGPNDPGFILYTSGSTGEPKGAVHRQAHIFYTNNTFCHEVLRLTTHDRLFSSSRLPFAYGLGNCLTFPLLNGATTILCRRTSSRESSRNIDRRSFSACR